MIFPRFPEMARYDDSHKERSVKRLLMVIPLLAIVSTCRAALPINTEVLKKAVVFIYPARPDGTVDGDHPLRTGFLVGVPKQNSSSAYLFLVTARHILDPIGLSVRRVRKRCS